MPEEQKIDFSYEEHWRVTALDRGSMRRLLGVKEIFGQSYGDLSSSIYYALGVVAVYAAGATPLALAIAGLFFVCTALSYTELTVAMPASGGSQLFARRAFNNDLISFTAGWVLLLDYILTIAISAFTIGPYLGHFYPDLKYPEINLLFTAGIIAFLTILNVIGIRESTLLCLILAIFDIVMRTLLILLGLYAVFNMQTLIGYFSNIGTEPTWERFIRGITVAMIAYTGVETVSQLSGEAKDYKIVIPKAMTRTVIAVLLMSLGVAFISVCAISPKELGTTWVSDPVAGVVNNMGQYGKYLSPVVAIFGAVILFIATNAGIVGASRLAYSMSSSYQVPAQLSKLHTRFKTPYIGLVTFSALAVVTVAIARSTEELVKLYSFGAMLAFGITHLSLIGLRIREPELGRPFKLKPSIPLGKGRSIPITAIIGLVATLGTWAFVVLESQNTRRLGFVWLAIGVISYLIYREKSGMPLAQTLEIEKINIPEFKEIKFKKILVPTRGGADTETVQIASRLAKENGAELIAINVMEIPATLPLDDIYSNKWDAGTKALARASAIAREYGLTAETKLLQSRSAAHTVCEVAKEEGCDLIVLGAASSATGIKLSNTISYILSNAPCRLWLCSF